MAVIARQYGFSDYQTIWNHPQNSALKRKRKNPNILFAGDVLIIPDKQEKQDPRGTGQHHVFQVRGAKFRYQTIIKDARDKPLANAAYALKIGSQIVNGVTNADGLLQQDLPLEAENAELRLNDLGLAWTVHFGHLDPIDTTSGIQQRLKSLGYPPGDSDGIENDGLRAALCAFQKDNGLPVDGACTGATRARIEEKYGC